VHQVGNQYIVKFRQIPSPILSQCRRF